MDVTRNHNGSITISKDIKGTFDTVKQTYYGYSIKDAKRQFSELYKTEKAKIFFNQP